MKTHPEKKPGRGETVFIATSESDGMMCSVLGVDNSGFSFKTEGTEDFLGRIENDEIIYLTSYKSGIKLIRKPIKIIGYHRINSSFREISQGITALENRQFLQENPGVAGMLAQSEYGKDQQQETKEPENQGETVNYLPEEVKSVFVKPANSQYDGTWQINLRNEDDQTILPLFVEMPVDSPVSSSSMAIGIGKVINRHLADNQYATDPFHRLPKPEIETDTDPSP